MSRRGSGRPGARGWMVLWALAASIAAVVAFVAAGAAPEPAVEGLRDPGPVTGWAMPLSRLSFDAAAVATIGCLVTAALVRLAGPVTGPWSGPEVRAMRVAAWSAAAWAASAVVLIMFTASDVSGLPVGGLVTRGTTALVWQLPQTRGMVVVAGAALVVALRCGRVRTTSGSVGLLVVALAGLTPALLGGHSAAAPNHDLATSSLLVHVLAASVWVGGLVGLLVFLRGAPDVLAATVPRYSALALVCFACVVGSGLLNAWVRADGDLALWVGSGYGALLLVKTSAVLGLGAIGWVHRSRSIPALSAGRPGAFVRLASGEVLLMAATIGVAVALARAPLPSGVEVQGVSDHGGHPSVPEGIAPFQMSRLLSEWRPGAVWLVLVGLGAAAYLTGWRAVRRAGQAWPHRRLAALAAAAVSALLATSGGLAGYATATFAAQVVQFLVLFLVVPALVCLAAPLSLALAAGRVTDDRSRAVSALPAVLESRQGRWLSDCLNVGGLAVVLVLGLYATGLLEASLRSVPTHLAVNLAAAAVGTLFWWSVLGVDPIAAPRPRGQRVAVLLGFLVLMLLVGVRVLLSEGLLAGTWFLELDWPWLDQADDQRRGAVLWLSSVLVLGPLLLACVTDPPAVRTGDPAGSGGSRAAVSGSYSRQRVRRRR